MTNNNQSALEAFKRLEKQLELYHDPEARRKQDRDYKTVLDALTETKPVSVEPAAWQVVQTLSDGTVNTQIYCDQAYANMKAASAMGKAIVQPLYTHQPDQSKRIAELEEITKEASFLLDRLEEFSNDLSDASDVRHWHGHVAPSIARLKALAQQKDG